MGANVKQDAHRLVDELADDATWDDVAYAVFVRQKVERGRKNSREGNLSSHEDVLREFGIQQ